METQKYNTVGRCANCGGDEGIHHYQTMQCPFGGRESPIGHAQEYMTSTYREVLPAAERKASDLTMRDYFAAKAMVGMVLNESERDFGVTSIAQLVAQLSYAIADAMLAEREKEVSHA